MTVTYKGKILTLIEDATFNYRKFGGDENNPPILSYTADAVDADGNKYSVSWETSHDFFSRDSDGNWIPDEDEGNACDWSMPISICRMEED